MKYHLTPDGPKECSATVKACKYAEGHFSDLKEAEVAFAANFKALSGVTAGNREGKLSAATSKAYAHWSVLNDHVHNGSAVGSPAELIYYSTAQGKLELSRRIRQSGNSRSYLAVEKALADAKSSGKELKPELYELDPQEIAKLVSAGEAMVLSDSRELENEIQDPAKDIRPAELRHYLIEESHRWMQRLTPEEQEAISWLTSNGFGMLQYAYGNESQDAGNVFKGLLDEDAIYDSIGYNNKPTWQDDEDWDLYAEDDSDAQYDAAQEAVAVERRKIAQEYKSLVLSALAKTHRLDRSVITVRGSSLEELRDITGFDSSSKDFKRLMDDIETGTYSGKEVREGSRMASIPQSATVRPRTAMSFSRMLWDKEASEDREVIISIKGRSFASPVNVGAWGTGEYEVFTNPLAKYKIAGGRRVKDDIFILELEE